MKKLATQVQISIAVAKWETCDLRNFSESIDVSANVNSSQCRQNQGNIVKLINLKEKRKNHKINK